MKLRIATREDVSTIYDLIIELAIYEKLEDQVETTPEILKEWIFDKEKAKVLLGEVNGHVMGYCLYCFNFSTFLGKAGIYIEDIYVKEAFRGNGYGTQFFKEVAQIAENGGYGRIDWSCLRWNIPSLAFYEKVIGATKQEEWIGLRLENEAIKKVSKL